ncbi:hypothetical protein [Salinibacterium sp. ZJ70]|uniref:hypothetical protein n=1 Tax=Salinibacterium sp. ZJ70 TaxID=2708084 RepID=UPI00141EE641|nr:hypothetical protein [Salinibacterium sp. ZJ70]
MGTRACAAPPIDTTAKADTTKVAIVAQAIERPRDRRRIDGPRPGGLAEGRDVERLRA